jgi:hypothetical protein
MNYQPEPMTLLTTLFDNQEEVKRIIIEKTQETIHLVFSSVRYIL